MKKKRRENILLASFLILSFIVIVLWPELTGWQMKSSSCKEGTSQCKGNVIEACHGGKVMQFPCNSGERCFTDEQGPYCAVACTANKCDGISPIPCVNGKYDYSKQPCTQSEKCNPQTAACDPIPCKEGEKQCGVNSLEICKKNQKGILVFQKIADCPNDCITRDKESYCIECDKPETKCMDKRMLLRCHPGRNIYEQIDCGFYRGCHTDPTRPLGNQDYCGECIVGKCSPEKDTTGKLLGTRFYACQKNRYVLEKLCQPPQPDGSTSLCDPITGSCILTPGYQLLQCRGPYQECVPISPGACDSSIGECVSIPKSQPCGRWDDYQRPGYERPSRCISSGIINECVLTRNVGVREGYYWNGFRTCGGEQRCYQDGKQAKCDECAFREDGVCGCKAPYVKRDGTCVSPCTSDMILKDGICVCKDIDMIKQGETCVCSKPEMVKQGENCVCRDSHKIKAGGSCVCKEGFILENGQCIQACEVNEIVVGSKCECKAEYKRDKTGRCTVKRGLWDMFADLFSMDDIAQCIALQRELNTAMNSIKDNLIISSDTNAFWRRLKEVNSNQFPKQNLGSGTLAAYLQIPDGTYDGGGYGTALVNLIEEPASGSKVIRTGYEIALYNKIKDFIKTNPSKKIGVNDLLKMGASATAVDTKVNLPLTFLTIHNVVRILARPWRGQSLHRAATKILESKENNDPMFPVLSDLLNHHSSDNNPTFGQVRGIASTGVTESRTERQNYLLNVAQNIFDPTNGIFVPLPGNIDYSWNGGSHYYFWLGALGNSVLPSGVTPLGGISQYFFQTNKLGSQRGIVQTSHLFCGRQFSKQIKP